MLLSLPLMVILTSLVVLPTLQSHSEPTLRSLVISQTCMLLFPVVIMLQYPLLVHAIKDSKLLHIGCIWHSSISQDLSTAQIGCPLMQWGCIWDFESVHILPIHCQQFIFLKVTLTIL